MHLSVSYPEFHCEGPITNGRRIIRTHFGDRSILRDTRGPNAYTPPQRPHLFNQTTENNNSEDLDHRQHSSENVKSYILDFAYLNFTL
jgi:hypothetical protein